MASAYAAFANGGIGVQPHVITRVRTANGKLLYTRRNANFGRVIDPQYVAMMNEMMQETLLTGTARKAELPGWQAAGKTGTSQDFRDAWFVGYTSYLVTAVWLGNDDDSPTKKASGGNLPVEIWSRFMKAAHEGAPVARASGGNMAERAAQPVRAAARALRWGRRRAAATARVDPAIRRPRRARAGSGGTAARADACPIARRPSQRRSVRFRRSRPARGRSRRRAGPEDQCLFEQDLRDTLGESAGFPAQRTVVRCYLSARTGRFPALAPGVSESCVRAGSTEFVHGSSPGRMTEERPVAGSVASPTFRDVAGQWRRRGGGANDRG